MVIWNLPLIDRLSTTAVDGLLFDLFHGCMQIDGGEVEQREVSNAYLPGHVQRPCYVAGGLVGGYTQHFLEMSREIRRNVDADDDQEIIAVWHDESHLNRFFAFNNNR